MQGGRAESSHEILAMGRLQRLAFLLIIALTAAASGVLLLTARDALIAAASFPF